MNVPVGPPAAGWTEPVFGGGAPGRTVRVFGAALRWPRSLAAWALILSVFATAVMVLEPGRLRDTTWNDTYRYITAIEKDLGKSDAEAKTIALDYYCSDLARTTGNSATRAGIRSSCITTWTAQGGLAPNQPRFNQIFDSRPGYPLLAAPFVAGFGLNRGLALLSVLLTLLAGWGVVLLIRLAGGGTLAALSGMIACYTLPTWFWLNQFLTEAPTLVCTIAVLIGAVLILRGRTRLGLVVSTVAYVCGFVVRYSTFSVQAGSMALTIGLLAWWSRGDRGVVAGSASGSRAESGKAEEGGAPGLGVDRRQRGQAKVIGTRARPPRPGRPQDWRNRRAAVLAGYSAGAFAVQMALPAVFAWPGFKASLEDTFTAHYTQPVPADLYGKWLSLNRHFWIAEAKGYLHDPLVPALVLLGAVLLWMYRRDFGAIVGAAALTGLASAAAHPLTSQLDRLYFQVYLLAICGLPLLADLVRGSQDGREAHGAAAPTPREDEASPGGSFVRTR